MTELNETLRRVIEIILQKCHMRTYVFYLLATSIVTGAEIRILQVLSDHALCIEIGTIKSDG